MARRGDARTSTGSREFSPMSDVLQTIRAQRVLPVLRSATAREAVDTALALSGAGARAIEITTSTPGYTAALGELSKEGLVVGLGTIRDCRTVEAAAAAGASFAVSFARPPDFVRAARSHGLVAIPAALTPQEVFAAREEGADVVKLFPARMIQPAHITDLLTVMPDLELVPSGGIPSEAGEIRRWVDAGAIGVAIGADLASLSSGRAALTTRFRGVLSEVLA
jgi:2-dehydro-3-deoxyphosphogluconate aldolase / (4S)-4-hydroxy-2-oxoglutarate aldolase